MMTDAPRPDSDPWFMIGYLSSVIEGNGKITNSDWRKAVAATDRHAERKLLPVSNDHEMQR